MLYEAGNDGVGQLAVAQVVLNRVRHPAFPHSVCGVVTQGSDRATGCQFTFTCDGALVRRSNPLGQAAALSRADAMLNGFVVASVGLATHYHTINVYPWWSARLDKIARVGSHLFFRWPGYWGSRSVALTNLDGAEPSAPMFARLDLAGQGTSPLDVLSNATGIDTTMLRSEDEVKPVGHQTSDPRSAARAEGSVAIPAARRLEDPAARPEQARVLVIGTPALGGNRLLRMFPEDGVFYLEVAPGSSDAVRRRAAELLCGGRLACRVYGWRNGDLAPRQPLLDAAAKAALTFTFIRTPVTGKQAVPPSAVAF